MKDSYIYKNINAKITMRNRIKKPMIKVLSFRLKFENLSSSPTIPTPFFGNLTSFYHEISIKKLRIMGK